MAWVRHNQDTGVLDELLYTHTPSPSVDEPDSEYSGDSEGLEEVKTSRNSGADFQPQRAQKRKRRTEEDSDPDYEPPKSKKKSRRRDSGSGGTSGIGTAEDPYIVD